MPSNHTSTPTHSPEEFCLALKAVREQKGITLAQIESATKIPVSVFVALERGDLRRWPKGIFKRSFFSGYIKAIGVPVAETSAEFLRLFPDEEPVDVPMHNEAPAQDTQPTTPIAKLIATAFDAIASVFGSASSSDGTEQRDMREWVTDARRVGPAPKLRVRIKLPK